MMPIAAFLKPKIIMKPAATSSNSQVSDGNRKSKAFIISNLPSIKCKQAGL
jgi:hypothetical protein